MHLESVPIAFTSPWHSWRLPSRRPRTRFDVLRCEAKVPPLCPPGCKEPSRRKFLAGSATLAATVAVAAACSKPANAFNLVWPDGHPNKQGMDLVGAGLTVYEVKNMEDVTLKPVTTSEALDDLQSTSVNAVFLGEHHYSYIDHVLQARILEALSRHDVQRPVAVGLEMVQQRFQPVLDAYINKSIDELDLYMQTEWETRWVWPFEQYLPIFRTARKLSIPLVALSADSELLNQIKEAGGMTGAEEVFGGSAFKRLSFPDPAFQAYVNAAIVTSYASHVRAGLFSGRPSFESFYANRVVRDEAMATRCEEYLAANPGALLISLLGIDHVKFGQYGVPGRLARRMAERRAADAAKEKKYAQGLDGTVYSKLSTHQSRTILLNPSNIDAYDDKDGSLMLDLRVRDQKPLAIADLLWFSPHVDMSHTVLQTKASERRSRHLPPGARLPHIEELVFE